MSQTQPALLFLSHRLPYPPHNGAALRTLNVLKQLQKSFRITMLCFDRRDAASGGLTREERIAALAPFATCEVCSIPQELSAPRWLWDHARSVATRKPYTWYLHDSRKFELQLRVALDAGDFALVHIDSLDLVRWLPAVIGIPSVCTHHNVESALLRCRAALVAGWRGRYLAWQADRLEEAERAWLPQVSLNVACSDDDAAMLRQLAPAAAVEVVPNGVDTRYFVPAPTGTPRSGIVCVGGTSWHPNRDALEWCVRDILPRVRAAVPGTTLTWIGKVSPAELAAYASVAGLQLAGYVSDVRPIVQRAACFIVPIRVGGGTRLKILDAWSMGAPVVSTRIGAEGLAAVHGVHAILADDADSMIQAVVELLRNEELQRRLGESGRRLAEAVYDWEVLGSRMRQLYQDVTHTTPPGSPRKDAIA